MNFIYRWQTLVGSILGGMFALATALIVARSARRRDEQASGMVVSGTLSAVRVMSETLTAHSKQKSLTKELLPLWFAEQIIQSLPKMPLLFDASVARLMPVDVPLAAHLNLFQQIYSKIEDLVKRVGDDDISNLNHSKTLRPLDERKADYLNIAKLFQFAVEHANCAEYLISKLVLSRITFWHRLRRHIL